MNRVGTKAIHFSRSLWRLLLGIYLFQPVLHCDAQIWKSEILRIEDGVKKVDVVSHVDFSSGLKFCKVIRNSHGDVESEIVAFGDNLWTRRSSGSGKWVKVNNPASVASNYEAIVQNLLLNSSVVPDTLKQLENDLEKAILEERVADAASFFQRLKRLKGFVDDQLKNQTTLDDDKFGTKLTASNGYIIGYEQAIADGKYSVVNSEVDRFPYSEVMFEEFAKQRLGDLTMNLPKEAFGVRIISQNGKWVAAQVFEDSRAKGFGLKEGDVLINAGGVDLTQIDDLAVAVEAIRALTNDDNLIIIRNDERIVLNP